MRLLQRQVDGSFRLTENLLEQDVSQCPYAVLSHRWEQASEEVTFEDITQGAGRNKAGYKKIEFCGQQAAHDGLEYFWVDSCCIKKSSDSELSEAINSMYRWYSQAVRCYVYLSDVSTTKRRRGDEDPDNSWELTFRTSKWFTRGWTLQELLAPNLVEFFSREWKRLGDKKSLLQLIHEVTRIAVPALQGVSLSQFSVDERFHWAQNRCTTREEDWAYCLLGIFTISMPLIYGEGRERAIDRLRRKVSRAYQSKSHNTAPEELVKRLPSASGAPFNSFASQYEPLCLPNTRVGLLQHIYVWANGDDRRRIFWLNGSAGTGKSTIARTVARRYFDQHQLGASFFFSRGGGDAADASKFVTSIAFQLASIIPTLKHYISEISIEHSSIPNMSLRDQWQMLVLTPLSKLESNGHDTTYLIVVDALDECDDERNIGMILQLFAETQVLKAAKLRVLLTSRPEVPTRHSFSRIHENNYQSFDLNRVSRSIADHDITAFLENRFQSISQTNFLCADWPGEEVISYMTQIAGGLFIWAATACRFIGEGKRFAVDRLDKILKGSGSAVTEPEKYLDKIYITVLQNSASPKYTDEEKEAVYDMQRRVIGSIVILSSPLSVSSISRILSLKEEEVDQALSELHSILNVPKDRKHPLYLHHPSFRDFILNKDRCKSSNFWVNPKQAHQMLADSCLQLMSKSLRQDICNVGHPGRPAESIESSHIEQFLPSEVRYACLYWAQHVQKSGMQLRDGDKVHQFLKVYLLQWMEALSWMRRVTNGISAITLLISHTKRFAVYNRPGIEQSPLQVYSSALCFSPLTSIVRKQYESQIQTWIQKRPIATEEWSAVPVTLDGHRNSVAAIAFAPDGKQLVSGSYDHTIRLWDVESGVVFAPDGKRLLSCSYDGSVRIWDIKSEKEIMTLQEGSLPDGSVRLWDVHSGKTLQTANCSSGIEAIAFSPNGKQLALGCEDGSLWIWDTESGEPLTLLRDPRLGRVVSVAFSPNGKLIASGSGDSTIQIWDVESGKALTTTKEHFIARDVAFSSDSKQLVVAGGEDLTARLWDVDLGKTSMTWFHSNNVNCVASSPNDKRLASGLKDGAIWLWDIASSKSHPHHSQSAELPAILEEHNDEVRSLTISPDGKQLASASLDGTVRLWSIESDELLAILRGPTEGIHDVIFSRNGDWMISASYNCTAELWDARSGKMKKTLKGFMKQITAMEFSADSRQLAISSMGPIVHLWKIDPSETLLMLNGHSSRILAIAFSPDCRRLASGSLDGTIKLWETDTGQIILTLKGYNDEITAVSFSPDGRRLASGSMDGQTKLWDTKSGTVLARLEGHSYLVQCVAFSFDSKQIASASCNKTVRLWDAESGDLKEILELGTLISKLSFSTNGLYLNTDRGTLRLGGSHNPSLRQEQRQLDLFVSNQWITFGQNKLLWLPGQFRATSVATRGENVILGHRSGRMTFMRFDANFLGQLE
ncbi:MAG: hypothetical protein Q9227_002053 [Pyrenula ochraceoflavens]